MSKRVKQEEKEVVAQTKIVWIVGEIILNVGTYEQEAAAAIYDYFERNDRAIQTLRREVGNKAPIRVIMEKLDALYQLAKLDGNDTYWNDLKSIFPKLPFYKDSMISFKYDRPQVRRHNGYIIRVNLDYWGSHKHC